MVKYYSNNCPNCKVIHMMMDKKEIEYEEVNEMSEIVEVATKYNNTEIPFAIINGEFYSKARLIEYIKEVE